MNSGQPVSTTCSHASSWLPRRRTTFAGQVAVELAHPRDHAGRVGPAVDVVAEEHDSVVGDEGRQAREELLQRREIAVDVADREGPTCHAVILV